MKKILLFMMSIFIIFSIMNTPSHAAIMDVQSAGENVLDRYVLHNPISIDGNDQFAQIAQNEGWPGNGTAENPYIIENYEIDGQNYYNDIVIKNTNVHFIIRNCYLHDTYNQAIYLYNVTNATIVNNTIAYNGNTNGGIGIEIDKNSQNIIIERNNIHHNNMQAIYITGSSKYISIIGNNLTNNNGMGIWIESYSKYINVTGNVIRNNNGDGIYITFNPSHITIQNNIIMNNMNHGIEMVTASTYDIIANNIIANNSKAGIYCEENTYYGHISYNTIAYNIIAHNAWQGIWIYSGSHNEIYGNAFYYNQGTTYTFNSSIKQAKDDGTNNKWYKDGWGNYWHDWANNNGTNDENHDFIVDYPYPIGGSANAKDNYSLRYFNWTPIRVNSDGELADLILHLGNTGNGTADNPYIIEGLMIDGGNRSNAIYIGNTTANLLIRFCYLYNSTGFPGSTTYFTESGLMIYNATNVTINETIATKNAWHGIYLVKVRNSTIISSNVTGNHEHGILVEESENITLRSNMADDLYIWRSLHTTAINNTLNRGIILEGSEREQWSSHTISDNKVHGKDILYLNSISGVAVDYEVGQIIIANSTEIYVSNQNISDVSGASIQIGFSGDIYITTSNLSDNGYAGYGIYIERGENITVENCTMYGDHEGISVWHAKNLSVLGCIMKNLKGDGISASSSTGVLIKNTMIENTWGGIYLSFSNGKIFNSTVKYSRDYGIKIYDSQFTIVGNLFLRNDGYAIYIGGIFTKGNRIYNNSFYYNHGSGDKFDPNKVQAYDDGTNYWNSTNGVGNYWHDWAYNNSSNDQNNDGIVDWPYLIDGSAGTKDYYPLKNATYLLPPSPPRNLTAIAGDGYVNLSWDPPEINGTTEVLEYRIYRNDILIAILPANVLWYNDTNVSNGNIYIYYVTAVNSVGESDRSNEVQAIPSAISEITDTYFVVLLLLIFVTILQTLRRQHRYKKVPSER